MKAFTQVYQFSVFEFLLDDLQIRPLQADTRRNMQAQLWNVRFLNLPVVFL